MDAHVQECAEVCGVSYSKRDIYKIRNFSVLRQESSFFFANFLKDIDDFFSGLFEKLEVAPPTVKCIYFTIKNIYIFHKRCENIFLIFFEV